MHKELKNESPGASKYYANIWKIPEEKIIDEGRLPTVSTNKLKWRSNQENKIHSAPHDQKDCNKDVVLSRH